MHQTTHMNASALTNFFRALAIITALSGCRPGHPDNYTADGADAPPAPPPATASIVDTPPAAPTAAKSILLGLLLDTSNSMDGLINQAKAQLWSIVNKLADARCEGHKPEIRVALYEYGNDRLSARGNHIRQVLAFTTNMDEVSKELFALTTNGGEEYCGAVIGRSVDELDWGTSDADLKMLVIAGNEPFTQGPVSFGGACERARQKGIVVNTIYCGDHNEGINTAWSAGALAANGSYFSIDQDAVTMQVASPYDDELAQLEQKWNAANIYYGAQGSYNYSNMAEQDRNAGSLGFSTSSKRREFKVKNSEANHTWDLTEVREEQLDSVLAKTERTTLPTQYRAMDKQQLRTHVVQLQGEKKALKERIGQLNVQREQYVAARAKAQPGANALENSILAAIETSARKKGMNFEEETAKMSSSRPSGTPVQ